MKIAIISDIHDNLPNLHQCLDWCEQENIERIICAGDITNSETLKVLVEKFNREIFLIAGNAEIYDKDELIKHPKIKFFGRIGVFQIEKFKIGLCHEPFWLDKVLEEKDLKYVFHGHTHKPWFEEKGGVKIYNPGTLGGVFYKASFAVWDTDSDKVDLKILETL
jgi:putative phosphoesterase